MLEHQPLGEAWSRRDAAAEYEDNSLRSATQADVRALGRLGLQYRYISSAGLEQGELGRGGVKVLMLPGAIAMSDREATEVRRFVARGGTVIADTLPAQFDQHSRRLAIPALADVFDDGRATLLPLSRDDRDRRVALLLGNASVRSDTTVTDATGEPASGVESHLFENGEATIIALTGPASAAGLLASLPEPRFAYDVLRGRALGRIERLPIAMNGDGVALFAVSPVPLRAPVVSAPGQVHLGDTVDVEIRIPAASPTARRILRVDVVDPPGRTVPYYSRNLLAPGGASSFVLPLALNDPPGPWRLRVTDLLSGQQATVELLVSAVGARAACNEMPGTPPRCAPH
jgi:hypothetical protein